MCYFFCLLGIRWFQTTFLDGCVCCGRREPLDECFGGFGVRCGCGDARGKNGDPLRAGRQRTDDVDALDGAQLADLLESNLELSCGNKSAHGVGLDFPALSLNLIEDAELWK